MRKIFRDNGLSIVMVLCLLVFLAGQIVAGMFDYNEQQRTHGQPEVDLVAYLGTPHFVEATTENWESEFLQMFAFVILTACLYQRGSAESRDPDKVEPVDKHPANSRNKKDAPWPVRKGGIVLRLYENSLSLTFLLLFLMSFTLHAASGAREYNQDQLEHGKTEQVTTIQYLGTSRFWFESFQNWQSEFLAVAAMVVFSIFLRQKGSPESKPVDAPHSKTGSE
jgi:succinate dehydrogenase hydrophobic anchor subunit